MCERPLCASSGRSPLVSVESGTDPFEILPLNAVVHQSRAHAVGGVITLGEQIMLVALETDALTVAIKICTPGA